MGYKSKYSGKEVEERLEKMLNVTWAELKALRDEGKLIAGQIYRMTDYETTCTWENTQCAGHPFDLVLTALDNKTLDEKCSAIWSERDVDGYFANSNLPAWDVRYCLDNDKNRFDWAQQSGNVYEFYVEAFGEYFTLGAFIGESLVDGEKWFIWEGMYEGYFAGLYVLSKTMDLSVGDTLYLTMDTETIAPDATGEITNIYNFVDGKGVIYRLIDEQYNDLRYDFKNIMFMRPLTEGRIDAENGIDTFCYTFSCIDADTFNIEEQSVKDPTNCGGNKFDVYCDDNVFLTFRGNFCANNTFGNGCYSNTFGDGCYSNTFGDGCYSNTFGDGCYSNTFGDGCYSNTFGDGCYSNTFGEGCYLNTFGDGCESNTFGDYCTENTFGEGCRFNTFGDYCTENTFGENCSENLFYIRCRHIVFISEKTNKSYPYYSNNILEGDNKYITITNTQTNYTQRFIKHIKICCGVCGDSSSPLVVDYTYLNKKQQMTVAFNSSGQVKVYCEADLVQ